MQKELAYLRTVDDVAWVEFEDNNVYVGFADRPSDLSAIINAAAMNGNRALDFGVHVWAVEAPKGWRPPGRGLICEATARGGKLDDPCQPR